VLLVEQVASARMRHLIFRRKWKIHHLAQFGADASRSAVGSVSLSENTSSTRERSTRVENSEAPALLHHAHDYGYSGNSESFNSIGMLTKVV
jgi:hypothetical protein